MRFTTNDNRSSGAVIGSRMLRVAFVVACVLIVLQSSFMPGTNAFFTDKAGDTGNTFAAGYWIPTLTMTVSPEHPDGPDGAYTKTPCVTLSYSGLTSGTASIWYEFSDDGDPKMGGAMYDGTCIPVPDGDPAHFQAVVINDASDAWRSDVLKRDFKVAAAVKAGDVIINEVMWMGSAGDGDDEWIELRNATDHRIDLSNWRIGNGGNGSGAGSHVQIPNGYSVKPNGYFLILKKKWGETNVNLSQDLAKDEGMTHVSGMSLVDTGEQLTLSDNRKNVIDKSPTGHWPSGWHGVWFHMSMERNDSPKDGTKKENWHTCVDGGCRDTKYWKDNTRLGPNFGTPGAKNLSVNDPSSPEYDPKFMETDSLDAVETGESDTIGEAGTGTMGDASTPGTVPDTCATVNDEKDLSASGATSGSGGTGVAVSASDTSITTGTADTVDAARTTVTDKSKRESDTDTPDTASKDSGGSGNDCGGTGSDAGGANTAT